MFQTIQIFLQLLQMHAGSVLPTFLTVERKTETLELLNCLIIMIMVHRPTKVGKKI